MIRRIATVALAAGLTLSLSGCSGESGEKADQAGGEKPELSAAQVLEKAAEKAGAVDTFQADLALSATGTPDGDVKQNGTMKYRLKPDRAFAMSFDDMSVGGRKLTGGEQRLIGQNMYVKMPAAADGGGVQTAKPWVRMSLDDIGKQPGLGLEKLLQESREMDPVQNTLLLTASKDVKKAGEETVDGVETTRYTGTYPMEDAIAKLPAELQDAHRKSTGEAGVKEMRFDLWVDGDQLPRQLVMKADRNGGSMELTIKYRDYGEPVEITEPPANEVM